MTSKSMSLHSIFKASKIKTTNRVDLFKIRVKCQCHRQFFLMLRFACFINLRQSLWILFHLRIKVNFLRHSRLFSLIILRRISSVLLFFSQTYFQRLHKAWTFTLAAAFPKFNSFYVQIIKNSLKKLSVFYLLI